MLLDILYISDVFLFIVTFLILITKKTSKRITVWTLISIILVMIIEIIVIVVSKFDLTSITGVLGIIVGVGAIIWIKRDLKKTTN